MIHHVYILLLWWHFDGGMVSQQFDTMKACLEAKSALAIIDPSMPVDCFEATYLSPHIFPRQLMEK